MAKLSHAPYEKIKDRWIDDAINIRISDVPGTVYHYTDAGGLFGMLNGKKLWLTDYRFLNDTTEFSHIYTTLDKVRQEILSEGSLSNAKRLLLSSIAYEKVEGMDSFVFSCSTERDDLSQWRGYAREGQGFTIGFDGNHINDLARDDDAPFAFAKVDYDISNQQIALKRAVEELSHQLEKDIAKGFDEDEATGVAAQVFDDICLNRGAVSKHSSFISEKEWRLVAYTEKTSNIIEIRPSGNKLIPYIEADICADGSCLPIKSVGIGPAFVGSEIVGAVETLLRSSGHKAEIYFADTPYRRP